MEELKRGQVVVTKLPEQDEMVITLEVGGKRRQLRRSCSESLARSLARISASAAPAQSGPHGGKKWRSNSAASLPTMCRPLFVGLYESESPDATLLCPQDTTNEQAWAPGRSLRVGEALYSVTLNPPRLARSALSALPAVGVPLAPALAFSDAPDGQCEFQWLRGASSSGEMRPIPGACSGSYTPRPEDEGLFLAVRCSPWRREPGGRRLEGWAATVPAGQPVTSVPPLPAATRERLGAMRAARAHGAREAREAHARLRVMTYNLLADQYVSSGRNPAFAGGVLPAHMVAARRRAMLLRELVAAEPDVLCLQEVDSNAHRDVFAPALAGAGLRGWHAPKAGRVAEGCSFFFRHDRFEQVLGKTCVLRQALETDHKESHEYRTLRARYPETARALDALGTVAQVAVLRRRDVGEMAGELGAGASPPPSPRSSNLLDLPRSGELASSYLCVVNTHLFFRDDASHVRSVHVWAALNAAQRVLQSLFPGPEPEVCSEVPVLFCGDLNSDLNDGLPGAVKLLGSGILERDYWDWASAVHFAYSAGGLGKDSLLAEEAVEEEAHTLQALSDPQHALDVSLPPSPRAAGKPLHNPSAGHVASLRRHHGPELRSAPPLLPVDGLATPTTNYVPGYSGLLDYCFVDPRSFEVVRCYPPPSPEDLGGFLPSEGHPSDHISVVADLRWKEPVPKDKVVEETGARLHPTWGYLPHPPSAPGRVFPADLWAVHTAAHCLGQGRAVVLPTDTLYGLGCDARLEEAFQSLLAIKQRPQDKPISLAVADLADVARVADVSHLPAGLLEALLPGPTTLILPFLDSAHVSPSVRAIALERGVGVRVPDAPFARAVARQLGAPLALTSANLAGEASCVLVRESEHLWPRCGAVFDAGRAVCEERLGSTVLDLQVPGSFRLVRRGVGAEETLRRVSREFGLREDAV